MIRIFTLILLTTSLGLAQQNGFYGPQTTKFYSESDILNGRDTLRSLDTLLTRSHRYEPGYLGVGSYQDLGVYGTAARPLFIAPDWSSGQQMGFQNYDAYTNRAEDIRFFKSYSPYTELTFLQNANRILRVDATFAKNITPQLNLGFKLHRFTVVDQIGVKSQNAIWMDHYDGLFFSSYEDKKGRYKATGSYSYFRHIGYETGGILLDSGDVAIDSILSDFETRSLTDVETHDRRNNWRFLQTFKLIGDSASANGVSIYHLATREKKKIYNIDNNLEPSTPDDFQSNNYVYGYGALKDSSNMFDSLVFRSYSNEVGLRFRREKQMVRGYIQHRAYTFGQTDSIYQSGEQHEIHVGGAYEMTLSDLLSLEANADVFDQGVLVRSALTSDYGYAEVGFSDQPQQYAFQELAYNIRVDSTAYSNGNNRGLTYIAVRAQLPEGDFKPYVGFKNISYSNYRYYSLGDTSTSFEGLTPSIKEANTASVQTIEVGYQLKLGGFNFLGAFAYNTVSDESVIPMPKILADQEIYFERYLDKQKVLYQIGFDIGFRSAYNAPAYQPIFQGFFNQQTYTVQDYVKVDFFANFQIRSQFIGGFRVFHLNNGFGVGSYQASPLYLGQTRAFELMIKWKFYN